MYSVITYSIYWQSVFKQCTKLDLNSNPLHLSKDVRSGGGGGGGGGQIMTINYYTPPAPPLFSDLMTSLFPTLYSLALSTRTVNWSFWSCCEKILTVKSLSEALILASIKPLYDNRLFIELHEIQWNSMNKLLSYNVDARMRAFDKDLKVSQWMKITIIF